MLLLIFTDGASSEAAAVAARMACGQVMTGPRYTGAVEFGPRYAGQASSEPRYSGEVEHGCDV